MKKYSILALIIALIIPMVVGGVSSALSSQGMTMYGSLNKPPLSPPAWVFPVVWTILYLMMGLASYYIFISEADRRTKTMALVFYAIQLAINFMWSIIFFNWNEYLIAFFWLLLLWCVVIICAFRFFPINKTAAYLLIPYIIWLTFAAYLNMGTYYISVQG